MAVAHPTPTMPNTLLSTGYADMQQSDSIQSKGEGYACLSWQTRGYCHHGAMCRWHHGDVLHSQQEPTQPPQAPCGIEPNLSQSGTKEASKEDMDQLAAALMNLLSDAPPSPPSSVMPPPPPGGATESVANRPQTLPPMPALLPSTTPQHLLQQVPKPPQMPSLLPPAPVPQAPSEAATNATSHMFTASQTPPSYSHAPAPDSSAIDMLHTQALYALASHSIAKMQQAAPPFQSTAPMSLSAQQPVHGSAVFGQEEEEMRIHTDGIARTPRAFVELFGGDIVNAMNAWRASRPVDQSYRNHSAMRPLSLPRRTEPEDATNLVQQYTPRIQPGERQRSGNLRKPGLNASSHPAARLPKGGAGAWRDVLAHERKSHVLLRSGSDAMLPSHPREDPDKPYLPAPFGKWHDSGESIRLEDIQLPPQPPSYQRCQDNANDVEHDIHRLRQRQKQMEFGFATQGYCNYRECKRRNLVGRPGFNEVPLPDIYQRRSKRSWDGMVRRWRQRLHAYDAMSEQLWSPQQMEEIREREQFNLHRKQLATDKADQLRDETATETACSEITSEYTESTEGVEEPVPDPEESNESSSIHPQPSVRSTLLNLNPDAVSTAHANVTD